MNRQYLLPGSFLAAHYGATENRLPHGNQAYDLISTLKGDANPLRVLDLNAGLGLWGEAFSSRDHRVTSFVPDSEIARIWRLFHEGTLGDFEGLAEENKVWMLYSSTEEPVILSRLAGLLRSISLPRRRGPSPLPISRDRARLETCGEREAGTYDLILADLALSSFGDARFLLDLAHQLLAPKGILLVKEATHTLRRMNPEEDAAELKRSVMSGLYWTMFTSRLYRLLGERGHLNWIEGGRAQAGGEAPSFARVPHPVDEDLLWNHSGFDVIVDQHQEEEALCSVDTLAKSLGLHIAMGLTQGNVAHTQLIPTVLEAVTGTSQAVGTKERCTTTYHTYALQKR